SPAAAYMTRMDVLVMPSLTEGLPMTLLEAMCLRIPIIATAVGGIPKLFENGRCGMLIQPASVSQIAEAVERMLQLSKADLDETQTYAYERVQAKYSSKVMAQQYA